MRVQNVPRRAIMDRHLWASWLCKEQTGVTACRNYTRDAIIEETQNAGLRISERCKNLLGGNWRAQVTSVDVGAASDGSQPKVKSFLAEYASPRGLLPPVLILHREKDSEQLQEFELSSLASLTIGRTDPQDLVQSLRGAGMRLPCLSLLGDFSPMSPAELGYILRRAQKVSSGAPGWPQHWAAKASDPDIVGLALDVKQVHYVDLVGSQQRVDLEEMDGAYLDPLAPGLARLLSSINTDETHTASLRDFCAAYMDVEVSSALMTQADRRGFSLIAKPVDAAKEGAIDIWGEYRLAFSRDANDTNAFMSVLEAMREEARAIVSKKGQQFSS